jgi:hypothetical protein
MQVSFLLKTKGMASPQMKALYLDTCMLHLMQEAAKLSMLGVARLTRCGRGLITLPRECRNPA